MTSASRTIVLFCGSFDPFTVAHRSLVESVLKLENVIVFVSPVGDYYTNHKIGKPKLTPIDHRFNMITVSLIDLIETKRVIVDTYEAFQDSPISTYEYMSYVKHHHPSSEILLLCGSDLLQTFTAENWSNAEDLIQDFGFLVVDRPAYDFDEIVQSNPLLRENISHIKRLSNHISSDISSTEIRFKVKYYIPISDLVCGNLIEDYIYRNRLYKD